MPVAPAHLPSHDNPNVSTLAKCPWGVQFTLQLRATILKGYNPCGTRAGAQGGCGGGREETPVVSLSPPLISWVPVTAEPRQKPEDTVLLPLGRSFLSLLG